MKKKVLFMLLSVLCSNFGLIAQAQSWVIGGNNQVADSRFGCNNNFAVIFETNNTDRGRITNAGLWGIGTTAPNSRLHVNSAAGQNGLRVQINGSTKLLVNSNGGVSVGSLSTPPANGLFVLGNAGIGTTAPAVKLHVDGGTDSDPSGGGFIVSGSTSGANISIDNNEIMARNNGVVSTLFLNHNGGNVLINGTNSDAGGGNVGIRTTSPAVEFHLFHNVGSGATNGLRIQNSGANANDWTFYTANSTGDLELSCNGNLRGSFDCVTGAYSSLSDARTKRDIEKAQDVLQKVLQLDVKKYHFLQNKPSDKKYYGLIAQEVENIFPEIVSHNYGDDGKDYYTMDYTAYGVIAIKAIQEQQQKIQEQELEISLMKEQLAKLEAALSKRSTSKEISGASLEQNQPNPFNHTTIIRYKIPAGANAQINIYDVAGNMVKSMKATENGQALINGSELKAGTYTYSLLVNGKLTISKKLVLMK